MNHFTYSKKHRKANEGKLVEYLSKLNLRSNADAASTFSLMSLYKALTRIFEEKGSATKLIDALHVMKDNGFNILLNENEKQLTADLSQVGNLFAFFLKRGGVQVEGDALLKREKKLATIIDSGCIYNDDMELLRISRDVLGLIPNYKKPEDANDNA